MEGDGEEMRIAGVYGANFADDEGNVLMGFEYSSRGEVKVARSRLAARDLGGSDGRCQRLRRRLKRRYVTRQATCRIETVANTSDAVSHRRQRQNVGDRPTNSSRTSMGPGSLWKFEPTARTASTVDRRRRDASARSHRQRATDRCRSGERSEPAGWRSTTTGMMEIPLERVRAVRQRPALRLPTTSRRSCRSASARTRPSTQLGRQLLRVVLGRRHPARHGHLRALGRRERRDGCRQYLPGGALRFELCADGRLHELAGVCADAQELAHLARSARQRRTGRGRCEHTRIYAGKRTTDNRRHVYQLHSRDSRASSKPGLDVGSVRVARLRRTCRQRSVRRVGPRSSATHAREPPNYGRERSIRATTSRCGTRRRHDQRARPGCRSSRTSRRRRTASRRSTRTCRARQTMDQTIVEANVQGELVDMRAGERGSQPA